MLERFRLIDSDAHVLEPADMFEKYLEYSTSMLHLC
jgi:hypothetical protein